MCTAVTYKTRDSYFGRNLDYEFSYGEEVVVMPRNYPVAFRHAPGFESHYAIVGMAFVAEDTPLFYDAMNEQGLGMAGLNFVGNARYSKLDTRSSDSGSSVDNIAQFELLPWILGQCRTVKDAKKLLERINIIDEAFSSSLPVSQLHWLIADRNESITLELTEKGMNIYPNPVGVLTNNPPFDYQMFAMNNYMALSPKQPENNLGVPLDKYSRGMGGMGLPGDLSSQSRFIRAAFTKLNSRSEDTELASVSQFFHILESVSQPRGCCMVSEGEYEVTLYSSCCNLDKGIYYYNTYDNHRICAVDMYREDLESSRLARYPITGKESILFRH